MMRAVPVRRSPRPSSILLSINSRAVAQVAWLLSYAVAFTALRAVSDLWAMGQFSLWFPAAGLRFAFLWRFGARMAPAAAVAELVIQLAAGQNDLGTAPLLSILGIVGPCLVYGAVIYIVQSGAGRRSPILRFAPLPFALAAIIGPIAACAAALPWAIPRALESGTFDLSSLLKSLLVFSLGDMLGVLFVAPPLVWLAGLLSNKRHLRVDLPKLDVVVEVLAVTLAAWVLVWALMEAGLGLLLGPILLATSWAGLRTGRPGAWLSILVAAAIVLPTTGGIEDEAALLQIHMLLACIAAIGYLAGSFAEAEAQSSAEIARRDRLLYQAERLRTLRAMSVAVIHEISQPLSTIAIEAKNLAALDPVLEASEVRGSSLLIARKAQDLSQLVRRLRRFGSREADEPSAICLGFLLEEITSIAEPEARAVRVSLVRDDGPEAAVLGQDIELRQALLNVLRNAIAAAPKGSVVRLWHEIIDERVSIHVENEQPQGDRGGGMGIGLIIAKSIVQAHGGTIERSDAEGPIRFTIELPTIGDDHE